MTFSVGEFRALRVLAGSRSGRRWLAQAPGRADPVVLRMDEPAAAARVETQFRAAARARHAHLLSVVAVATSTRYVALVEEFAPGGSLRDRLTAGPLRPGQVVTLIAAVSAALAHCHDELGAVHGGVGASRVLFTDDGRPLLAGLGAVDAAIAAGHPPDFPPSDVSPEVARGAPPVPADDVFALGSVALLALCGMSAWPAEDLSDVVVQSGYGQWPEPDESCPAQLARLLRQMLARSPGDRPTAAEVYRALADCGDPEPVDLASSTVEPVADGATQVDALPAPDVAVEKTPPGPGSFGSLPRRRGRHADDEPDIGAVLPTGLVSPGKWLDAPDAPSWSLTAAGGSAEERESQPLAVTPVASSGHAARAAPRVSAGRAAHRRPHRWRRTAATSVVALALAVASVIAGLWWASSDATPGAVLPPVAAGAASSTAATTSIDAQVDWLAVVTDLDERRSNAFATSDTALLSTVYAPDAPALAIDAERIRSLTEAGLRVDGLRHAIDSARLADDGGLAVEVVDSMPAQPILDDTGTIVAHTAEQATTTRIIRLAVTGDGYRIAEIVPVT